VRLLSEDLARCLWVHGIAGEAKIGVEERVAGTINRESDNRGREEWVDVVDAVQSNLLVHHRSTDTPTLVLHTNGVSFRRHEEEESSTEREGEPKGSP